MHKSSEFEALESVINIKPVTVDSRVSLKTIAQRRLRKHQTVLKRSRFRDKVVEGITADLPSIDEENPKKLIRAFQIKNYVDAQIRNAQKQNVSLTTQQFYSGNANMAINREAAINHPAAATPHLRPSTSKCSATFQPFLSVSAACVTATPNANYPPAPKGLPELPTTSNEKRRINYRTRTKDKLYVVAAPDKSPPPPAAVKPQNSPNISSHKSPQPTIPRATPTPANVAAGNISGPGAPLTHPAALNSSLAAPLSSPGHGVQPVIRRNASNRKLKKAVSGDSTSQPERISAPAYLVYYYSVAPGNNSEMVERVLASRSWWKRLPPSGIKNKEIANKGDSSSTQNGPQVQFYWKMFWDYSFPFSQFFEGTGSYLTKKSINRFTHSDELGDKDNLFRNMWFMCQRKNLNIFEYVPLTFSFRMHEFQFERDLQDFCRLFLANQKGCSPSHIKPIKTYFDDKLKDTVQVYFDFGFAFPQRYSGGRKFNNTDVCAIDKRSEFFAGKNMWIIKPSGCDRGKGVEIFKSLEELSQFLMLYTRGYNLSEYIHMDYNDHDNTSPALKEGAMAAKAQKTTFPKFVIQKYMEKPALFKGYKFDIRAHALLTQDKSVYVFRDSYVRICSLQYSLSKHNYFAHLCNTSVNMKSDSFGNIAAGNTISVVELAAFFDQQERGKPNVPPSFEHYLFEEIKRLVKLAFDGTISKSNLINPTGVPNSFELYGFDIMVDESYRCWLIEANFVPGLTDENNDYLRDYLDRMTDDMFKLTIDEMYPRPRNAKKTVEHFPFMNFKPDENLWKFVCKYEN
jgi:hypothetical protein